MEYLNIITKWYSKNKNVFEVYEAQDGYKYYLVWRNILVLLYLHSAALYGGYLVFMGYPKFLTYPFIIFLAITSSIGVTGGAHRLWSHKSYSANLSLRIFWAVLMSMTFQNHIYEWARDHRVHHKFSETTADPHNANRGFFFSHVGWLMVRKHKDVIEKGKTIDMSDLEQDGVVMFQKKYYSIIMPLMTFVFPMLVPYYCWNEDIYTSFYVASMFRYIAAVNLTWCINSVAHIYGPKPYDKNIGPTESKPMFYLSLGEGFHNYHHTFPWDYKASEFGGGWHNVTTLLIDYFAKIGWATELKEVPTSMIKSRAVRTGDGSWDNIYEIQKNFVDKFDSKSDVWGWGDKDMPAEDKEIIIKSNNLIGL